MIQKFEVHIAQHVLDEVTVKLQHTRWPDEITNSGWQYGADLAYMKELTDYWINRFDWRKTEQAINSYDNFTAHISGYDIHFMYCKGNGPSSIPLLITHGWPYSFLEMFKIIPLLTGNHEISFDLIIPSMLGYGFSQKITHPGCNVSFMADLWVQIMKELGYERFGVQGGDFGAGVSTAIAMKYPENLIGMHLNYIPGNYEPVLSEDEKFSDPENEFLEADEEWYHKEGGYSLQQRTKPLTLAYSLNDSPVGLCAWIIEKMYGWAECNGDIERVFTKDELLSNVMLYWVTETIHSSI